MKKTAFTLGIILASFLSIERTFGQDSLRFEMFFPSRDSIVMIINIESANRFIRKTSEIYLKDSLSNEREWLMSLQIENLERLVETQKEALKEQEKKDSLREAKEKILDEKLRNCEIKNIETKKMFEECKRELKKDRFFDFIRKNSLFAAILIGIGFIGGILL